MAKHNVFRNDNVHVCERLCSTCIFRPGNLMHLEPGRVEDMIADAEFTDGTIVCHKTLDGDNAVCRGFFNQHATPTLRMAIAFKAIKEVPVG